MARKVFFSFYYDGDIRRVVQVRNSWRIRPGASTQPFLDKAEWESIARDDAKVEKWINDQLHGTSVTAVLFGSETYSRPWVKHEIKRSYELGKGMIAIDIHRVKDPQAGASYAGKNPLSHWSAKQNGRSVSFDQIYKTYDWVLNDGYKNFGSWVEAAATAAGR